MVSKILERKLPRVGRIRVKVKGPRIILPLPPRTNILSKTVFAQRITQNLETPRKPIRYFNKGGS